MAKRAKKTAGFRLEVDVGDGTWRWVITPPFATETEAQAYVDRARERRPTEQYRILPW
jgi:hypothetical protein